MLFDNVYTEQKQPNGDIMLIKKDIHIKNFIWSRQPNGDILLKRITVVSIDDLRAWNFCGSVIQRAIVDKHPALDKPSFRKLYSVIHEHIGDGAKIIKHSILNIKTVEDTTKGFCWIPKLGISIQGVDANKALLESITQCVKNNISIELTIMVKDQTVKITV
jgi:hypothetical protein